MDPRTAIVPRCPPERCGLHRRNADPTPCSPRRPVRPCLARPGAAGPGGRLPQSPRAHHREHIGRRRGRHGDPHHRRGAPGEAWPALRHRGPRRRGGNIGAEAVYTADPDGYTLLASQPSPITSNIALYKKLNFDPAALESVAVLSKIPNLLLVRQDFPAKTAAEFIAYAKGHPGGATFASQGPGTTSHLSGEQFSQLLGARMVHVPYRGTGPALNDLIGGQVDCMITELATAYKLHTGGKARILAVATERRLDDLPDIPTVIEAGVPGFLSDTWNAISAPPKTPAAIIAKLNRAVNATLDEPEVKERYRQLHLLPGGGSPADMAKLKKEETERWTRVIRDAGIEQQ